MGRHVNVNLGMEEGIRCCHKIFESIPMRSQASLTREDKGVNTISRTWSIPPQLDLFATKIAFDLTVLQPSAKYQIVQLLESAGAQILKALCGFIFRMIKVLRQQSAVNSSHFKPTVSIDSACS